MAEILEVSADGRQMVIEVEDGRRVTVNNPEPVFDRSAFVREVVVDSFNRVGRLLDATHAAHEYLRSIRPAELHGRGYEHARGAVTELQRVAAELIFDEDGAVVHANLHAKWQNAHNRPNREIAREFGMEPLDPEAIVDMAVAEIVEALRAEERAGARLSRRAVSDRTEALLTQFTPRRDAGPLQFVPWTLPAELKA